MRLGILGGTFDPVHHGHLDAARAARDALQLDRVVLVPARVPPHRDLPTASGYHRFAMAALAIQGIDGLAVSDMELQAPGPSYTVLTLRRLHERGFAAAQLFFITGVDAFAEVATWHQYPALLDASHFVVVSRPGHDDASLASRLPAIARRFVRYGEDADAALTGGLTRVFLLTADTADVSSTSVRARLVEGGPVSGLLPNAVAEHVRRHRLYDPSHSAADLLHDES